jgi:hypothetical protein
MIPVQGFPEEFAVEVSIDLGSGNAFMAQHFLYGAEIGAAFHEMCGEGMAEGVRGDVFSDAGLPDKVFQEQEDHDPGEPAAAAVEEEDILMAWLDRYVYADILHIDADIFDGGAADGYQSFLISLADHADIPYVEVEAGDPQVDDFTDAESAAVHCLEDSFVTPSFGFAKIDMADDVFDLVEAEYVGKGPFQLGGFQQGSGILPDDLFDHAIFIEGPDAGQDAGLGGSVETQSGYMVQESLKIL